jgi:hypothetical protein
VINRKDFNCWGQMPKVNTPEYKAWFGEARKFGKAIWDITGKGVNVDMVFEHPGEATFPVSTFVVKRGGMVVICAGTTGFNLTMDARYHLDAPEARAGQPFRHLKQAMAANKLMLERRLDPCMSEVFPWADPGGAHEDDAQRAQAGQHGGAGLARRARACAPEVNRGHVIIRWTGSQLDWSSAAGAQIMREALDAGLGNQGWSVPIWGPHGEFALFT